jgi:hypothetical protein
MGSRASRYATLSQISLAAFSALCVAMHPGLVLKWNEGGFSNYGIHIKTVIPYSLAFGLCAFFAFRAASSLSKEDPSVRALRHLLGAYGVLMLFTLASTYPYKLNTPLKDIHTAVGIVTLLFEPISSAWMYASRRGLKWDGFLLATALVGLILAVVDLAGILHVLFLAQVFTGVGFGFLLVRTVSGVSTSKASKAKSTPW